MLIMGPHWCNIACIRNLILIIKSVTPVEINVSIYRSTVRTVGGGKLFEEGEIGPTSKFIRYNM